MSAERDIAVLQSEMARAKQDILDLRSDIRAGFADMNENLSIINTTLAKQRGATKVIGLVFSTIGAMLALAAQWAIAHWK